MQTFVLKSNELHLLTVSCELDCDVAKVLMVFAAVYINLVVTAQRY